MTDTFIPVGEQRLKGLDEALKKLRTLAPDLQKKGLNAAVRKGANLVRREAIKNAKKIDNRETPNKIWKNVAVQYSAPQSKRNRGVVIRVGVRGGARKYGDTPVNRRKQRVGKTYKVGGDKGNPGGDTWYFRFIEFGAPNRGIAARPFLLPALRDNSDRATTEIADELNRQIDKFVAKGGK